jgi:hypothetical protein
MGKKNKSNTNNYEIVSEVRGWCKLSCREATLITGKLILNNSSELVVTRDYEGPFPVYFVKWNDKNIPRDKSLVTFIGCKNDNNIVELTILD